MSIGWPRLARIQHFFETLLLLYMHFLLISRLNLFSSITELDLLISILEENVSISNKSLAIKYSPKVYSFQNFRLCLVEILFVPSGCCRYWESTTAEESGTWIEISLPLSVRFLSQKCYVLFCGVIVVESISTIKRLLKTTSTVSICSKTLPLNISEGDQLLSHLIKIVLNALNI